MGDARENVWGRAYRRANEKRKKAGEVDMLHGGEETGGGGKEEKNKETGIVFRIRVVELAGEVVLEWVRGRDRVLWESLCGMVHRGLRTKSGG